MLGATSMMEILIVIVLSAILIGLLVPEFGKWRDRAHQTKAAETQELLQGWYNRWTMAGAVHNTSTTNAGAMAFYLLQVAGSDPTDTGVSPQTGDTWVDETKVKIRGQSFAGAERLKIPKPYQLTGSEVVYDSIYSITFDPNGTSNRGTFTVTVMP